MDPVTLALMLGSVAAPVAGGVVGNLMGAQGREESNALLQRMYDQYGKYSPDTLGPSAMEGVQVDPSLKASQLRALQQFQNIQDSGGLTLEDQAALQKVQNQLGRQETAGRGAITNNMEARGTLGSGAELAMALNNQQNSAERANEAGLNTEAAARKRYFDSIMAQGQMAGQMRSQDFGEQSHVAEAKDAIARYNNAAKNAGQQFRIQGQAGALGQQAATKRGDAQATQQMWSGIGQGVNQGLDSIASYGMRPKGGGRQTPAPDMSQAGDYYGYGNNDDENGYA